MNKLFKEPKIKNTSSSILRKSIFLYSAVIFLLFGAALSLSIIFPVYNRLKTAEENNVYHASEIRAMVIDEWFRNAKNLAFQITSRTRIREELEKYNENRISLNQLRSFTEPKLRDAMALSGEILGITRLDKEGKKVAECGVNLLQPWPLNQVTGTLDVSVSDPVREKNYPAMIVVSAPIINRSNVYLGRDQVLISLNGLEKILFNYTGLGKQSNIILAYASGDNVFPVFDEKPFFNMDENNSFEPLLEKAINGSRGMGDNLSYVAAYHNLRETDWGLLILQQKNELYNSLNERLFYIGCIAFIIYLTSLLGFIILTKPLADKILLHHDELEEKIREKTIHLQDAMDQIKTLKGIVPICATCKKIRDDKGYWNHLEVFLEKNSEASFSHGICQECSDKIYKDEIWYQEMKQEKKGG